MIALRKQGNHTNSLQKYRNAMVSMNDDAARKLKKIRYSGRKKFWNSMIPLTPGSMSRYLEASGLLFLGFHYLIQNSKYRDGEVMNRTYSCYSMHITGCPAKIKVFEKDQEFSVWCEPHNHHRMNADSIVPFFGSCLATRRFQFAAVSFLKDLTSESNFSVENRKKMIDYIPDICKIVVETALKLLSMDRPDPITEIYHSQAINIVLNLASGTSETIREICKYNIIPYMIQVLRKSQCEEIRCSTIWALGNIFGDSDVFRDYLRYQGVCDCILDLLEEHIQVFQPYLSSQRDQLVERINSGGENGAGQPTTSTFNMINNQKSIVLISEMKRLKDKEKRKKSKVIPSVGSLSSEEQARRIRELRLLAWTISNSVRGKNVVQKFTRKMFIRVLETLSKLTYIYDEEALADVLWSISYCTDISDNSLLQTIPDFVDIFRIVNLIEIYDDSNKPSVVTPCVRIVGNLATGSTTIGTGIVTAYRFIEVYSKILRERSSKLSILKELVWTVSNLVCDSVETCLLLKKSGIFDVLFVKYLKFEGEEYKMVNREVLYVFNNLVSKQNREINRHVVRLGSFDNVVGVLDLGDTDKSLRLTLEQLSELAMNGKDLGLEGRVNKKSILKLKKLSNILYVKSVTTSILESIEQMM